ncbi:MAG TPA: threonine synthase [Spirillospora sp.]|nr:threonine synthase [Spirillospora sp.]
MAFQPELICETTGQPVGPLDWQCDGARIRIANQPPFDAAAIRQDDWSLWRYAAMLPVEQRFSLGEGCTPLVRAEVDGIRFRAKLEYLNPTGSYKDRGTSVLVNQLLGQGVREVVEDSSGNAGASLAAYASATGLHARIFAPASAPEGKKKLIASFGAELVEVPGPRAATTEACLKAAETSVYATHAWSPFFLAGQMTCAWEIWEQMGRRVPDAVICPVGHGGLFTGLARGFEALRAANLVERLPRLYAVQSAACDPVVQAWERGLDVPERVTPQPGVADGISIMLPVHGAEILAAVRATGGAALRIDDAAILEAQRALGRRGFIVEPTSAITLAALKLIHANLPAGSEIVLALTGSGLKTLR